MGMGRSAAWQLSTQQQGIKRNSPPYFNRNLLKGTVSIISSDPPCKDDNARFTKVPLKSVV